MFTKEINSRKRQILLGTTIALLASLGVSQSANAQQQPVRSNIAPRPPVRSNLVPTTNIRSNLLAPSVQDALSNIANELGTTVDALLSSQQIAEIALSPAGAEVLNSLQADDITGTEGNFTVESNVPVATVESPQGVSVGTTLDILDSEE